MKNLMWVSILLFVSSITSYAQNEKEIVYVGNFTYTNNIGSSYVEGLRNKIIEGLATTNRLNVKDMRADVEVNNERNKATEDASAVNPEDLVKFKNLQAKYLIQGHVTSLETVKKTTNDGKVFYSGSAVFDLKIIDVETGTLKTTKNYTYSGSGSGGLLSYGVGETPEKAIADLLKTSVESDMKKLVNEEFPVEGTILEITEVKKEKATQVYIDLGELHGMNKGQAFDVYVEREVAGRVSQKKIGELKIEAVEGNDISLCKVNKGGEEIKTAVGEGQKIIVKSVHKGGIFG